MGSESILHHTIQYGSWCKPQDIVLYSLARSSIWAMGYRNRTYVIFDGDSDIWAYGRMKGWNALPTVDFDFYNAHDLGSELTDRASEQTVKARLRLRFGSAKQVVLLIGGHTRYLYRFVRWELDVALQVGLPIVAVNLNGLRAMDDERCPPIIRTEYVVHVPFKLAIIKHALDKFPREHNSRLPGVDGPRYYPDSVYEALGLNNPPAPSLAPPPPAPLPLPRLAPPLGSYFAGLLSGTQPPPRPLSGLGYLAGLGDPPRTPSDELPNLFRLEDFLK
jgi:antiphage defense system Thoeris ThsB-like protein